MLARFGKYLRTCIKRKRGRCGDVEAGVRSFLRYLREIGVARPASVHPRYVVPPLLRSFGEWMERHRGATSSTRSVYERALLPFVAAAGEDPRTYDAIGVREFVRKHLGTCGTSWAKLVVTSLRMLLRYLAVEGRCASGIDAAVPSIAQWRLASTPRYLERVAVDRIIASCDVTTAQGQRDRAILLLLARLGLRAGDIVAMRLEDLDWKQGTLRVRGKGRRDVLLPLPQEVGDALLAYLARGRRAVSAGGHVFLRGRAPYRRFASSMAIGNIVSSALRRAGITDVASRGAHLLRHSAATAMLRAGSSLDAIAQVLRHRSRTTTAYYAKVDLDRLRVIAQPWPEVPSC